MPKITTEAQWKMLDRACEEVLMHGGNVDELSGAQDLLNAMDEYGMEDLYYYWSGNFTTFDMI